jgi:hypothetical protein
LARFAPAVGKRSQDKHLSAGEAGGANGQPGKDDRGDRRDTPAAARTTRPRNGHCIKVVTVDESQWAERPYKRIVSFAVLTDDTTAQSQTVVVADRPGAPVPSARSTPAMAALS